MIKRACFGDYCTGKNLALAIISMVKGFILVIVSGMKKELSAESR
ncbi:MAG TPA: hypothetical protein PKL32_03270 [Candidatus Woesebacteria bacterium]|nr:hypothetical protein [Candidatus Woesebacteria bacterium]